jgi:hypothetical protein
MLCSYGKSFERKRYKFKISFDANNRFYAKAADPVIASPVERLH